MIIKLSKERKQLTKEEIVAIANRSYFHPELKKAIEKEIKYLAKI